MVRIGQKRTEKQMTAEESSSKAEKVEGDKEEEGEDLKRKRGLDGKMLPVEQR